MRLVSLLLNDLTRTHELDVGTSVGLLCTQYSEDGPEEDLEMAIAYLESQGCEPLSKIICLEEEGSSNAYYSFSTLETHLS